MSLLKKIRDRHQQRQTQNLWRQRQTLQSAQGAEIEINNQRFFNFCSNDYLGLANHPALIEASVEAVQKLGTGSGAAHLICGHHEAHHQLEHELAAFAGAERALLFSNGYMANLSVPPSFLSSGDFVFQDRLNHASLIDAGLASPAKMVRYQHGQVEDLAARLDQKKSRYEDASFMIATDGVFSMDGDVAPITELKQLADKFDALLYVDEAHGFGVLGAQGRGSLEAENVSPTGNVLMMGTLGKAAGVQGAFVAGDSDWIEHIIQFGRTYIYTTAIPAMTALTLLASLSLIRNQPELRERLKANIRYFRSKIQQHPDLQRHLLKSETPIQALIVGDADRANVASSLLRDRQIMVSAIRPPTVPNGMSRLRITLTANHNSQMIDKLVDSLSSDLIVSLLNQED